MELSVSCSRTCTVTSFSNSGAICIFIASSDPAHQWSASIILKYLQKILNFLPLFIERWRHQSSQQIVVSSLLVKDCIEPVQFFAVFNLKTSNISSAFRIHLHSIDDQQLSPSQMSIPLVGFRLDNELVINSLLTLTALIFFFHYKAALHHDSFALSTNQFAKSCVNSALPSSS